MKEKQTHYRMPGVISILAGVGWFIFISLFTLFWSTNFTFFQNIIIDVISVIILGVVTSVAWIVWRFRTRKSTSPESLEDALKKALIVKKEASKLLMTLTEIKGIGPKRVKKLENAGIRNMVDLANSSAKQVAEKTGIPQKRISGWIEQAKRLAH